MMLYPSLNELAGKIGSRYALVIAISKRARELTAGDPPMVDTDSNKPVSIAVQEIAKDKITVA